MKKELEIKNKWINLLIEQVAYSVEYLERKAPFCEKALLALHNIERVEEKINKLMEHDDV